MDLDCLEEWVVPWRCTVGSLAPLYPVILRHGFRYLPIMCLFLSFSVRVYLAFSRDESIWQVRALSGKLPGSGGKGLVDSLIYKRKLRDHLFKDVMPTYKWDPAITAAIRSAAPDPLTFAKKTTAEDLTW